MKIIFLATIVLTSALCALPANAELRPFTSDGCSAFPDGQLSPWGASWTHCCVAHDLTYWRGGRKTERQKADRALVSCVNDAVNESDYNPSSLGWVMWLGIKIGGSPYQATGGSPFPWRWGYGWKGQSRYKDFSIDEKIEVASQLHNVQSLLPSISTDLGLKPDQMSFVEDELYLQIVKFQEHHGIDRKSVV